LLALKLGTRAVTSLEYALIAAFIALLVIESMIPLGKNVANTFSHITSEL